LTGFGCKTNFDKLDKKRHVEILELTVNLCAYLSVCFSRERRRTVADNQRKRQNIGRMGKLNNEALPCDLVSSI
jgi:hypothetical protein